MAIFSSKQLNLAGRSISFYFQSDGNYRTTACTFSYNIFGFPSFVNSVQDSVEKVIDANNINYLGSPNIMTLNTSCPFPQDLYAFSGKIA